VGVSGNNLLGPPWGLAGATARTDPDVQANRRAVAGGEKGAGHHLGQLCPGAFRLLVVIKWVCGWGVRIELPGDRFADGGGGVDCAKFREGERRSCTGTADLIQPQEGETDRYQFGRYLSYLPT
jgi:hypothetical protein